MKLGELKSGNILYIIHWSGGHIEYIDKCIIKDTLDIKIGRIIHYYKENDEHEIHGTTLEFSEYENKIAQAYYLCQMCSDKEILINTLNKDKEDFLNKFNNILNNLL